jgi:hypothetical protein
MNAILKPVQTIEDLAIEWLAAKAAETKAIERRRNIDAMLVDAMVIDGDEGTMSEKYPTLKVSVTKKLTRTVDTDALTAAWDHLPEKAREAFKWKADLDIKKMRAIQDVAPNLYAELAQFVTTKLASPAVKVEEV